MHTINRTSILQWIAEHFQSGTQWFDDQPAIYHCYMAKAEALIEVLEISDCGSTGGFDNKNPLVTDTNHKLFNRFLTVLRKYREDEHMIRVGCGFTLKTLSKFYDKLGTLRSAAIEDRM